MLDFANEDTVHVIWRCFGTLTIAMSSFVDRFSLKPFQQLFKCWKFSFGWAGKYQSTQVEA